MRILHVSPEKNLGKYLKQQPVEYYSIDIEKGKADLKMDLTNLTFPDHYFDAIVCSNVLEHIQNDHKAISELYRVLKPTGWAILQTPYSPITKKTIEDSSIVDPIEREQKYGQSDHVRLYGLDYFNRLKIVGFDVHSAMPSEANKKLYALGSRENLIICHKSVALVNEKLAMTLFVKNEIDIILDNIFYHLEMGVDEVLVTDNFSNDGTYEIILALANEFSNIHLFREPAFRQEIHVNNMACYAREVLGCSYIFHNDADEFWRPKKESNLKTSFLENRTSAGLVKRKNIIPDFHHVEDRFPQKKMWLIENPCHASDIQKDSIQKSLFIFDYDPKVFYNCQKKNDDVVKGNHNFVNKPIENYISNIEIHHIPFKSYQRYKDKINQIVSGYISQQNNYLPNHGWNSKRFHQIIKEGNYDDLVKNLLSIVTNNPESCREFDYEFEIRKYCTRNKHYNKYYSLIERIDLLSPAFKKTIGDQSCIRKQYLHNKIAYESIKQSKIDHNETLQSTSWKITEPLRQIKDYLKK